MKIVHLIPGFTWERGGPSAVVLGYMRHQRDGGHEVTVVTTDQGARHGEQPVDAPPGVRLERLRVWGPDRLAYAPGLHPALRRILARAEVLHVHSIFTYPVHAALTVALEMKVPVVLRPCGQLHPYSLERSARVKRTYLRCWGQRVRRACAAWHFTSEQEAQQSWPHDDSPRFVIPNGIEPGEFRVDRKKAREGVAARIPGLGREPYALFLGRLHPKKRMDLLLQAFLAAAPPEARLVVAGPDECGLWDTMSQRFLQSPEARQRVVRLGTVTGADKAQLLAAASVFALPSEHENFGVAALEALAAGTPVLLSSKVDLAGVVEEEHLGWSLPLEVDAWRDRLSCLLREPEQQEEIGQRAPAWVESRYSWRQLAGELVERYRWVLAGCPARPLDHPGELMPVSSSPGESHG